MDKQKNKIIELRQKLLENYTDELVEKIIEANNVVIDEFCDYLIKNGLSKKTVDKHTDNVDTFANYYLTTYDYTGTIFDGYKSFDDFFGYWLITKYIGCSKTLINDMISSMKKFYSFLFTKKYINQDEADLAFIYLKEGKEEWLEQLEMFFNGTYYSQFD